MRHHLLIVEDDEGLREGLRRNFEFEGYRVSTAADGVEGLEAARCLKPDLVILDIMLPKMNGFEVCRQLRMLQLHLRILVLTVRRSEADRAEGRKSGADDYMVKPFNLQALSARVRDLLASGSFPRPTGEGPRG